jgi:hypothetical protein
MTNLTGTFRSGEQAVAHPVGYGPPSLQGSSGDDLVFGCGESHAADLGARVLDGRPAGSVCHVQELYGPQKDVDKTYFAGHNKYMTTKRYPADQICAGVRVVPPGKKRLVEVLDHNYDAACTRIEVAYITPQGGRGVFFISRYDEIEIEARS